MQEEIPSDTFILSETIVWTKLASYDNRDAPAMWSVGLMFR